MSKLILLRGVPGSGKTTYATELCLTQNFLRINWDDLRRMMLSETNFAKSQKLKKFEEIVIEISFELCYQLMQQGYDIVIDNTNLNESIVKRWRKLAESFDYEFEIITMETTLEECIERDRKRLASVGEKVIRGMYDRYCQS